MFNRLDMFNRTVMTSALIAPALAISTPALAASSFTGSGSENITNGNGVFTDTAIPAGLFADTIQFSVASEGIAEVGVLYFEFVTGISNIAATFNGTPITFANVVGNVYSGGITAPVSPGLQTITVSGISNGTSASYSGIVRFSAVPEIGTWLMMIAGIGFAGFALRRRRIDYAVNYAF